MYYSAFNRIACQNGGNQRQRQPSLSFLQVSSLLSGYQCPAGRMLLGSFKLTLLRAYTAVARYMGKAVLASVESPNRQTCGMPS
jgi:hypothetical protein